MGGKGRVSNDLVAASCAAVLAVYAAGYWRTRDEARRIDVRAPAPAQPPPQRPDLPSSQPEELKADVSEAGTGSAPLPVPVKKTTADTPVATVSVTAPTPTPSPEAMVLSAPAAEPPMPEPPAAEPAPDPEPYWRDGTYTAWGTSRHGDIKALVVIKDGRIVESGIASCETRYPCDVISEIINQPVARQSPEVDRVSRATESADAYYYGLVAALDLALALPPAPAAAPR